MHVIWEEFHHSLVGAVDVFLVAAESNPTERTLSFTEQWTNVGRHEAWELEGVGVATLAGFVADRVTVVEHFTALGHETNHGFNLLRHRLFSTNCEFLRVGLCVSASVLDVYALRDVIKRVVSRSLVGDDVYRYIALQNFSEDVGGISNHTDRDCLLRILGSNRALNSVV